jgi:small subunit ribosomal protein S16
MTLAVRIRLSRVGATKRPAYRVVAIDRRRARDGRALEILGFYDPLTDPATVRLDAERINAWIGKGALPSDMVRRLLRQAEGGAKPAPKRAPAARKPRAKASSKPDAAAKTAAAAEAPSEPAAEEAPSEPAVDDATTAEAEGATAEASAEVSADAAPEATAEE